jgi:hypothetical protein
MFRTQSPVGAGRAPDVACRERGERRTTVWPIGASSVSRNGAAVTRPLDDELVTKTADPFGAIVLKRLAVSY